MQFYTVTMKRKHLVTCYDHRKKPYTRESFIEETYRDLPYSTANAYRSKFPDAFVSMTEQNGMSDQRVKAEVRFNDERIEAPKDAGSKSAAPEETPTSVPSSYAEVINKMTGAAA